MWHILFMVYMFQDTTIFLYLIRSRRSLFGSFRYIYNRKKVLFIAPINDYRRIQINAFPCADNGKQVEGRVIFFSLNNS